MTADNTIVILHLPAKLRQDIGYSLDDAVIYARDEAERIATAPESDAYSAEDIATARAAVVAAQATRDAFAAAVDHQVG